MKQKRLQKFIGILIIAIWCIFPSFIILAQSRPTSGLEVVYPTLVPGVAPPRSIHTYLPHLIRYFYTGAVALGGLVAFLAILTGGFRYLTSVGNPGRMADARNQIFSGLIGLAIILGSYVLLNEISPQLTEIRLPAIRPFKEGIILYNKSCGDLTSMYSHDELGMPELLDLPSDVKYLHLSTSKDRLKWPDESEEESDGLIDARSFISFHDENELQISFFPQIKFNGNPILITQGLRKLHCYDIPYTGGNNQIGSVKLKWYRPGVWLFAYNEDDLHSKGINTTVDPRDPWEGCGRENCFAYYTLDAPNLPIGLNDNIKAIALVRDVDNNVSFGAILHNGKGDLPREKGWAQIFLPDERNEITVYQFNQPIAASSLTVFAVPSSGEDVGTTPIRICRNPRCIARETECGNKNGEFVLDLFINWNSFQPQDPHMRLEEIATQVAQNTGDRRCSYHHNAQTPTTCSGSVSPRSDILGRVVVEERNWYATDRETGDRVQCDEQIPKENPHILRGNHAGVTMVEFDPTSRYIVMLYDRNLNPSEIAKNGLPHHTRTDVAVTRTTIYDLSTLRMNERTNMIVVLRTGKMAK